MVKINTSKALVFAFALLSVGSINAGPEEQNITLKIPVEKTYSEDDDSARFSPREYWAKLGQEIEVVPNDSPREKSDMR
ncbi:hypothetical protein HOD08_03735 [bacterium]|nr:hypothetical protein [bacterium]